MSREISHYVVTAHPPGGVLHTVKCNFLAEDSEVRTALRCIIFFIFTCHWTRVVFVLSPPIESSSREVLSYLVLCCVV